MKHPWLLVLLLTALTTFAPAMGRKEAHEKKVVQTTAQNPNQPVTMQGIRGKVEIWIGNFMPLTDRTSSTNKILPGVNRRVRAYPPQQSDAGAHRDSIAAFPVAETVSDSTGSFYLPVPPGTYSVFVEDSDGWYFNGFNGQGIQGAVTVKPGETSEMLIKITNKATF